MENSSVALLNPEIPEERLRAFLEHATASFAYRQLSIFGRLGVDSRFAPHILLQDIVAGVANSEYAKYRQYTSHLTQLCGSENTFSLMQRFEANAENFHERTTPVDWVESITKAYIVGSLNEDYRTGFARALYANAMYYVFSPEMATIIQATVVTLSGDSPNGQQGAATYAPLREVITEAISRNSDLRHRLMPWMHHLAKEFLGSLNSLGDNPADANAETYLLQQVLLLYPGAEPPLEERIHNFHDELVRNHSLRAESLRLEGP